MAPISPVGASRDDCTDNHARRHSWISTNTCERSHIHTHTHTHARTHACIQSPPENRVSSSQHRFRLIPGGDAFQRKMYEYTKEIVLSCDSRTHIYARTCVFVCVCVNLARVFFEYIYICVLLFGTYVRAIHSLKNDESKKRRSRSVLPPSSPGFFVVITPVTFDPYSPPSRCTSGVDERAETSSIPRFLSLSLLSLSHTEHTARQLRTHTHTHTHTFFTGVYQYSCFLVFLMQSSPPIFVFMFVDATAARRRPTWSP